MPKRELDPSPGDGGSGRENAPITPLADVMYTTNHTTQLALRDENLRHLNGQGEGQPCSQDIVVGSDAGLPVYSTQFRLSYLYRSALVTNVTRVDMEADLSPYLLRRQEAESHDVHGRIFGLCPARQRLRRAISNSWEGCNPHQPWDPMVAASIPLPECAENGTASFWETEYIQETECLENGTASYQSEECHEDRSASLQSLECPENESEKWLLEDREVENDEVFGEVDSLLKMPAVGEVVPLTCRSITPVCKTAGCLYRRCSV